VPDLQL